MEFGRFRVLQRHFLPKRQFLTAQQWFADGSTGDGGMQALPLTG
jgi:hypothetical protein